MIVVTKTNVLTVGIDDKAETLQELTVKIVSLKFGTEAVRSFKNRTFDSVISKWNLPDMADGKFLKALKSVKPEMPTIAVVECGNVEQEVAARSLGVSAVITDQASDEQFLETVSQILGLAGSDSIRALYAVGDE